LTLIKLASTFSYNYMWGDVSGGNGPNALSAFPLRNVTV